MGRSECLSRIGSACAGGLAAIALMLALPAAADPYADGLAAAQQGDFAAAVDLWRPLAEAGHTEAQARLGFAYRGGWGVAADPAEAAAWYLRAAEQGFAPAFVQLGHMHADGAHFPQDDAAAVEWYRRAAEAGDADGQYYLGSFYFEGRGVARDFGEGYRLWQAAWAQGHEGARAALCADIADFCEDEP